MDIRLLDYQTTTAAWPHREGMRQAIENKTSGLSRNSLTGSEVDTWIGRVKQIDADANSNPLGEWQCRNNLLAHYCLQQGTFKTSLEAAIEHYGGARIGIIVGSSTSAIDRTEAAYHALDDHGQLSPEYQQPLVHNPHALGLYVAHLCAISGPTMTINTACSSSAKVFASAARWLACDLVDAVLVGGTDALGLSVVHGFDALQLVSNQPCRPFDQHRNGINIGEAAGFALLARNDHPFTDMGIALTGFGESSDAHHMSHPHPEGVGAQQAIEQALTRAGLDAADIDYINLHGTASLANDAIEGDVIQRLFPATTRCSSTKAWTGHTLGAAGITEALITAETLRCGIVPANLNLQAMDAKLNLPLSTDNQVKACRHALSNSFGFGGNNCSLVFSRCAETDKS